MAAYKSFKDFWRRQKHLWGDTSFSVASEAWHAAIKHAEALKPSHNTGSPKLPLDELKRYLSLFCESEFVDYDSRVGACDFVDFIERQLRAGA